MQYIPASKPSVLKGMLHGVKNNLAGPSDLLLCNNERRGDAQGAVIGLGVFELFRVSVAGIAELTTVAGLAALINHAANRIWKPLYIQPRQTKEAPDKTKKTSTPMKPPGKNSGER